MPVILTIAATTSVAFKYLLTIPAMTMFAGAVAGVWLARRYARPLETWGWLLMALSMGIGLLIGMYAFDGPLPAPSHFEGYNNFVRRLSRLDHAYCIVLGLVGIFVAREAHGGYALAWWFRLGQPLLVVGMVLMLVAVILLAATDLPTYWMLPGPVVVVAGLVFCLAPTMRA
jgi:hypothetical protein